MRKNTSSLVVPTLRRAMPLAKPALDPFDRGILAALVEDARATNVEIAEKVGLSEAPCSRRIRRLEADKIIRGYSAVLEPDALGIGLSAFVTLVLENFTAETSEDFIKQLHDMPEVLSCHIVSGGFDAVLHVVAADARAYSEFVLDRLRLIPGVKDVRSSFVMRTLKQSRGLPFPPPE